MPRAKAEALLSGVLDRARAANESDQWLDWVHRVLLYGSLADETRASVGDVDVAIALVPRVGRKQYRDMTERLVEADQRALSTFVDRLGYPAQKLLRNLRSKSPRIDLIQLNAEGEGIPPGAPQIEVYRFDDDSRRPMPRSDPRTSAQD